MAVYAFFGIFLVVGLGGLALGIDEGHVPTIGAGALFAALGAFFCVAQLVHARAKAKAAAPAQAGALGYTLAARAPLVRDYRTAEIAKGWIFAVVGTIVCLTFPAMVDFSSLDDEVRLLAFAILGIPTAVGYLLAAVHLRQILRRRGGGAVSVEIAAHPLPREREVSLRVTVDGPLSLTDAKITLECRATFARRVGQGSDRRFVGDMAMEAEHPVAALPRLEAAPGRPAVVTAKVRLPEALPPSGERDGVAREWVLAVRGKAQDADDWERAFAVQVA